MEYMPLIIDAAIILIIVACVFIGRFRGFAASVLSFAATIACMIVAKIYASPVAVKITELFIHDRLHEKISTRLSGAVDGGTNLVFDALPSYLIQGAENAGFNSQSALASSALGQISEKLTDGTEKAIVIPLVTCVIFVLLYIISKFISRLCIGLANAVTKLPLIKQINRSMGGVMGALKGIVFVFLAVLISMTVTKFIPGTPFAAAAEKAEIYQFIVGIINSVI